MLGRPSDLLSRGVRVSDFSLTHGNYSLKDVKPRVSRIVISRVISEIRNPSSARQPRAETVGTRVSEFVWAGGRVDDRLVVCRDFSDVFQPQFRSVSRVVRKLSTIKRVGSMLYAGDL